MGSQGMKPAKTEDASYLDREGRPIGLHEWDRRRSDPQYSRLAQTVMTGAGREVAILTTWFGINLHPGPLFDTIRIEAGRREPLCEYDTEGAAFAGHQDAVAEAMEAIDRPSIDDSVNDRWDEFVGSVSRLR